MKGYAARAARGGGSLRPDGAGPRIRRAVFPQGPRPGSALRHRPALGLSLGLGPSPRRPRPRAARLHWPWPEPEVVLRGAPRQRHGAQGQFLRTEFAALVLSPCSMFLPLLLTLVIFVFSCLRWSRRRQARTARPSGGRRIDFEGTKKWFFTRWSKRGMPW